MNALEKQEGGSHYKDNAIQPVEYCQCNGLGFCESSVIKYVTRHKEKGKAQDIRKAIHFLELLLELEYPPKNPPEIRPDSEGWWWRLWNGKNGPEWGIGEAKVIYWEESAEPEQERLLAWSTGGCWTRCDKINAPRDSGTRWFKQEPPILRHSGITELGPIQLRK